jgi:hypothetical protein
LLSVAEKRKRKRQEIAVLRCCALSLSTLLF